MAVGSTFLLFISSLVSGGLLSSPSQGGQGVSGTGETHGIARNHRHIVNLLVLSEALGVALAKPSCRIYFLTLGIIRGMVYNFI